MKKEKYIVEIEMPDGDGASPLWVKDVLQCDADMEDEGRWKVSVKECWEPSEKQMEALKNAIHIKPFENPSDNLLLGLYKQLKKLKEEEL